jgi:hypothetical protein
MTTSQAVELEAIRTLVRKWREQALCVYRGPVQATFDQCARELEAIIEPRTGGSE